MVLSCWTVKICLYVFKMSKICFIRYRAEGILENICHPQKVFPTSYNPTVFDTYPTDMVLADEEKTVSGKSGKPIAINFVVCIDAYIGILLLLKVKHYFTISQCY